MTDATKALRRALPSLVEVAPPLNLEDLPEDPVSLFLDRLTIAQHHEVAEPRAMTLSTIDASGVPDARVLVLKDVDERGWAFASTRTSVKGGRIDVRRTCGAHLPVAAARALRQGAWLRGRSISRRGRG